MAPTLRDQVSRKVDALLRIEALVDGGLKTTAAIDQISRESGIPIRTLYRYRKLTDFVPRAQWAESIAPKWNPAHGMKVTCHPQALDRFVALCRSGIGTAESYRRTKAEAEERGWVPFAPERTMRPELTRRVDPSEIRRARREAGAGI